MSNTSQKAWSDGPNAPDIPHWLYFAEKANFAGLFISTIFYGIVTALFFQCLGALTNPINRTRESIKWGLVAYTVIMFSFVTVFTATNLDIQSISYIDNREFPGMDGVGSVLPPGPLGYQFFIYSKSISIGRSLMFLLSNWLADGLLLYRCYVVYSMNYWVIAFPCLMYLASFAMGIAFVYRASQPDSSIWNPLAVSFGLPYFSISVSLNILLSLMIIIRLVLHNINIRNIMGAPAKTSGLYQAINAIVIMLVESSALYAVTSLLFIGPWSVRSYVGDIFLPILAEIQVIAPFLIIRRVADQKVLAENSVIVPANTNPVNVTSQGKSAGGYGALPDGYPMGPMGLQGKTSGELGVVAETMIYFRNDEV